MKRTSVTDKDLFLDIFVFITLTLAQLASPVVLESRIGAVRTDPHLALKLLFRGRYSNSDIAKQI